MRKQDSLIMFLPKLTSLALEKMECREARRYPVRSTLREFGVLQKMRPHLTPLTNRSVPARRSSQSRRPSVKIAAYLVDGMELSEFQALLLESCQDGALYTYRESVSRLRLLQTLSIECKFWWVPGLSGISGTRSRLKGMRQHIRAAPSFYNNEPLYDFVELSREQ